MNPVLRPFFAGEVEPCINGRWLQFSFPTRWHHDVLRALDSSD